MEQPRFNEDYVEYHLYQLQPHTDINLITEFVQSLCGNYIWQKDTFSIRMEELDGLSHMFGYTRFGDNIEDEWFIVYILFEISKRFPNIVISVMDTDGHFLLIEAAFAIPKWLKPDNSDNRVFIQGGKVHIIPPPRDPYELSIVPSCPTTKQAIELILNSARQANPIVQTEASKDVQQIIYNRIEQHPEKAKQESVHYVACWLPIRIAWILHQCPQLVTRAVSAFYYRDALDMKHIYDMKAFPPSSFPLHEPPNSDTLQLTANEKGSVLSRVRFTRCSYAQLQRQQFDPPPCFGYPPPLSHKYHKAWLLGAKLAAGFEILYRCADLCQQQQQNQLPPVSDSDENWVLFDNLLKQYGYYYSSTGCLHELQTQAKERFVTWNLVTKAASYVDVMSATLIIHNILQTACNHTLPVFPRLTVDDDESWLEISVEHLDMLLKERGSNSQKEQKKKTVEADVDQERFNLLIDKMTQFMDQKSSFQGVETEHSESDSEDHEPIEFDPTTFLNKLSSFGTQEQAEDDEDDNSDDEENDTELMNIMKQMDLELRSNPNLFNSFETEDSSEETPEGLKPVDINLNMVKNLLDSYSLQQGMPGPLTNILGEMYHTKK